MSKKYPHLAIYMESFAANFDNFCSQDATIYKKLFVNMQIILWEIQLKENQMYIPEQQYYFSHQEYVEIFFRNYRFFFKQCSEATSNRPDIHLTKSVF